jgi:hypothetical protein
MVLSGVFRRSFRSRLSQRLFAVRVAEHGLHGKMAEESLLKLSKVVSKVFRKINWGKFVISLAEINQFR